MRQRKTEWLERVNSDYHERQFKEPYRSTVGFCDWLEEIGCVQQDSELRVIDLGSGRGANIYYMARRYPRSDFVGVDINPDHVTAGNKFFHDNQVRNCRLERGDIYKLKKSRPAVDGIVSLQTLSWLPDFREPLLEMVKLQPKWIALSSLFYDGPISCTIEVKDYDASQQPIRESFYNIYSLPVVRSVLSEGGYSSFQTIPFEIDIDLPRPSTKERGTYTEKLQNGHRIQMSGPLLLPWYFIAARMSNCP